jgi:hypothetical protein
MTNKRALFYLEVCIGFTIAILSTLYVFTR